MQVDKTTLADLSIFHAEEEQSVFNHFNHTQTNGGREYLRYIMGNPLSSVDLILDTQQTIRQLMEVAKKWPLTVTNGTIMVIERYYESQIAAFANRPNAVDSLFYKLLNGPDYSLVRYTVEHTIDFVKGLYQIVSLLQDLPLSKQLSFWTSRMATLLSKPMIQEMLGEEKKNLSPQQIITYGSFIRYHFKNQSEELVEYILSHFQGQN